jgi:hypothetical protein
MKPAERSSNATVTCRPALSAKAWASGVEREPGEITTCVSPRRRRVRTPTSAQRAFVFRCFVARAIAIGNPPKAGLSSVGLVLGLSPAD